MKFLFLGVDLGGEENTWAVAVDREGNPFPGLSLPEGEPVALAEILDFIRKNRVLAAALDAPISFSLTDRKGLREADHRLREILRGEGGEPGWVVSYHALMGIPVRGLLLAEALAPMVGTIIETHPRAALYLALPQEKKSLVKTYKGLRPEAEAALRELWRALFPEENPRRITHGLLDASVCALTARAYHLAPENLLFLPSSGSRGFGPFVVLLKFPCEFFMP